ncbi:hypothetical protein ACKKBF_B35925 [Auxenochlorella protothecoides x Auxenochlorella symbiontica]
MHWAACRMPLDPAIGRSRTDCRRINGANCIPTPPGLSEYRRGWASQATSAGPHRGVPSHSAPAASDLEENYPPLPQMLYSPERQNMVHMIGHLVEDPSLAHLGRSRYTASLTLSVSYNKLKEPLWVRVRTWHELAVSAGKSLAKNDLVFVEGYLAAHATRAGRTPFEVHAVSMRRVVMPPPSPQPRNESAGRRHEEGRSAGQFRPGTPSTATQPVSEKAGCLPAKSPRGPAHTGLHPTASVQPQSDSRPPRAPQAREVPAVASETWTSEALRTAPRRKRKTSLPGQRRASIFQDRLRGVVERGSRPH